MTTSSSNPPEISAAIPSQPGAFPEHPWIAWLIIAAACLLAILPFAWRGSPSGHDFEFHMYSWMDVQSQWRQGVVYPRWAAMPHWGYGEPRFVFYPPFSWTLGAALGSLLPWKFVPAAYCWLSLTLAGGAMYRLALRWLQPSDSLFAAVFYALNPYHLLIVYWRSAYAELLAAALLPLLILLLLRLKEPGSRATLLLSLLLAAAWLTNVPTAIMIHYSAGAICLILAFQQKSFRYLWKLAIAVLHGAGLASIYLIPAMYEQRWVNIAEVLSPGVRPQDNFLFTMTADPDHNRFNLLISFVAVADIAALLCAIYFSRRDRTRRTLWTSLAIWGGASAFATLSVSDVLWKYLPALRFVQLPFRWLLCMNAAFALLLTMAGSKAAWQKWTARALVCTALLAAVIVTGQRTQPPWWYSAEDIDDMQQSMGGAGLDGSGNEGVDEYVPAGADPYELNKNLPRLSIQPENEDDSQNTSLPANDDNKIAANAPITHDTDNGTNQSSAPTNIISQKITKWNATEKHFQVFANNRGNLTVRLFNYPAWKVTRNGRRLATATSPVTGLVVLPIEAGENDVEITFTRTPDRTLGDVISILSMGVFIFLWVTTQPIKTQPPGDESSVSRQQGIVKKTRA
ncbi:MAG: 6-pyruvoyl-tetrahydropterin synthase-related protein [Terriglobales bacterium]